MREKWIFDVGVHDGADSAFYLAKGFHVVGVEGYPVSAARLRERFAREIAEGRFFLEEVAIGEREGTAEFYVHRQEPYWNRTELRAERGEFDVITVPYTTFDRILSRYPRPYYIKCDIEESDWHVIRHLNRSNRPTYFSFELSRDYTPSMEHLRKIGYSRFQVIEQKYNVFIRPPSPAREGRYVDVTFDRYSSGLFGRELQGDWRRYDHAIKLIRRLDKKTPRFLWADVHAGPPESLRRRLFPR